MAKGLSAGRCLAGDLRLVAKGSLIPGEKGPSEPRTDPYAMGISRGMANRTGKAAVAAFSEWPIRPEP